MPGQHSDKEKRQAAHVKASYKRQGYSDEEAEELAWKTVNKGRKEYRANLSDLKRGGKGRQH